MEIVVAFWETAVKMAPWLLFGFLAAGVLSLFFTAEIVSRHLGRKAGYRGIFLSVLLGVPLPLCSCGVLPVAVGLRKGGASKGATAAFLISTPQTGIDSFFATYALLGWAFALFRPIVAFFSGLLGGIWVDTIDREAPTTGVTAKDVAHEKPWFLRLPAAVSYGFGTLFGNVAPALLIGLLLSAAILAFVPDNFFAQARLGSDWVAFPVMLLIGMPMYVCSTASIPVALALIAKGISPGAALVFLIVGPALNGASLTTLLKLLGKRCAAVHLFVIASSAVVAGLLLNLLEQRFNLLPEMLGGHEACCATAAPALWQTLCGGLLLALLAFHLLKNLGRKQMCGHEHCCCADAKRVVIKGMMCDHCRGAAMKLLKRYPTVTEVVQVAPDAFSVKGELPESLAKDIEDLGFELVP